MKSETTKSEIKNEEKTPKIYTREEAISASLEYFKGDLMAAEVWINKYCLKNLKGELLELIPENMHKRMAKEFSIVESKYNIELNGKSKTLSEYGQKRKILSEDKIFEYFDKFKYIIPQGSVMASLGNPFIFASLSNCIVLPEVYDSYGGIMYADQQLTQLMKRRCVEENTMITTKERGIIPIKDVKIGEHVLSFDIFNKNKVFKRIKDKFSTNVKIDDRIKIVLENGTILKTSKKHPVLVEHSTHFGYLDGKDLLTDMLTIKPEQSNEIYDFDQSLSKLGWFIGAHLGDGSCDIRKGSKKNPDYAGNDETVVKEYTNILNGFNNLNTNYNLSKRKDYRTKVWELYHTSPKNKYILNTLFDGQSGSKTYSGKIPTFIKENNLWIPFIAGLIDTDRTVSNSIIIGMSMKPLMDELCSYFASIGVSYNISNRLLPGSKSEGYILRIHQEKNIYSAISKFIIHPDKKRLLSLTKKPFGTLNVFDSERNEFENRYKQSKDSKGGNFSSCAKLNRNKDNNVGIGIMNEFMHHDIVDIVELQSIQRRLKIKRIEADIESAIYLDIEVEDTNNFFAGNFGQICIHNCGVGLDISTLRPEGSTTSNSAGSSTGAISFMERFSNTTREVAQSGRRGALMLSIDCNHIDIEKFATIKHDLTKVTGANISIKLSDEFMNCVKKDTNYTLKFPINSENPTITKVIKARDLWNTIVSSARNTAEPGLIFWDRQHHYSTSSIYPEYKNIGTNPCAEIAMGADSCRLIALNLFGCVKNPFAKNSEFDYEKFYEVTYEAQRLMDDLVDLELECVDKILKKIDKDSEPDYIKDVERRTWELLYKNGKNGRRTGLGFTALADTIAALGYKFDSNKSLEIIEKIMKTKCEAEFDSSIDMAIERGKFVGFDTEIEEKSHFVQMLKKELPHVYERMMKYGRRNVSISTVAPSGSLSICSQTSSGLEPVFMTSYKRRRKINPNDKDAKVDFVDDMGDKWQENEVFHPKLKMWKEITGKTDIKESPYFGATAEEIDWIKRVKMQSVIQRFVSHSLSSCLTLDSLILTSDGLMYLDELYDFETLDENKFADSNNDIKVKNYKGDMVNIGSYYNNGTKPVFNLILKNGLSIRSTGNEKYILLNEETGIEEWKQLSDLNIGDRIKIS